ncbi:AAC(3) family N-acetyltransferase [Profundibacter sp.]
MTAKKTIIANEELISDWRSSGVNEGDVLLVHSSVQRTCRRGYSPKEIMQSFLDAVGPDGTVLFPLFNFKFCSGDAFDIRSSPSRMGVMTEAARIHPDAVRTGHPAYSFAVIGARSNEFSGLFNHSGYGPDSPFAKLRDLNGKIAVLNLDGQHSMTFYHHVEEMHGVHYRYHKNFAVDYTDINGVTTAETFSIFVRNLEKGVLTDVNNMDDLLWEQGLYTGCKPKEGHGLRVINACEMYNSVSCEIKKGNEEGLLFNYEIAKST